MQNTIELNSNGNTIVAVVFQPTLPPKYAVILSCPTGTKQSYYQKFSEYLCKKGILVVTYDYSGIGKSAPKQMKGYDSSLTNWAMHDLTVVIDYVSENFTYQKLVLIGLSIGGQIVGLTPSTHKVDAIINVASQWGYWRLWPIPIRYILFINWYVLLISAKILGYFPKTNIEEGIRKSIEWYNKNESKISHN